jgi:twitching motility protein PilT
VFETLVATAAIRNLIREGKTAQMQSAQQTGAAHGMQTMAQALSEARANRRIAPT